jgi:hypothetical protein
MTPSETSSEKNKLRYSVYDRGICPILERVPRVVQGVKLLQKYLSDTSEQSRVK